MVEVVSVRSKRKRIAYIGVSIAEYASEEMGNGTCTVMAYNVVLRQVSENKFSSIS